MTVSGLTKICSRPALCADVSVSGSLVLKVVLLVVVVVLVVLVVVAVEAEALVVVKTPVGYKTF